MASPRDVYAFLSVYKDKRPAILPPAYEGYTGEKGGRGAGTVVRWVLKAGRRQRPYRLEVAEPSKGSVLTVKDASSSLVNTWTVDTVPGNADRSRVTITTGSFESRCGQWRPSALTAVTSSPRRAGPYLRVRG